jgi:hypothetical protein
VLRFLPVLLFAACLSACGGSSNPNPNTTPDRSQAQHLYIANSNGPGSLVQFMLPLTNSSTPSLVANPLPAMIAGAAVDPNGNLVLADNANHLILYSAPIQLPLTPTATINNGTATSNGPLAFNAAGDLFAVSDVGINVFMHPFLASSTPSQTIAFVGNHMTVDPSGTIYQIQYFQGTFGLESRVLALVAPYSGPPAAISPPIGDLGENLSSELGVGNGLVFASNSGRWIDSFPTLGSTSGGFTIRQFDGTLAVDRTGNLYVYDGAQIHVFAAPLSASSLPSANVNTGTTNSSVSTAMAIGK